MARSNIGPGCTVTGTLDATSSVTGGSTIGRDAEVRNKSALRNTQLHGTSVIDNARVDNAMVRDTEISDSEVFGQDGLMMIKNSVISGGSKVYGPMDCSTICCRAKYDNSEVLKNTVLCGQGKHSNSQSFVEPEGANEHMAESLVRYGSSHKSALWTRKIRDAFQRGLRPATGVSTTGNTSKWEEYETEVHDGHKLLKIQVKTNGLGVRISGPGTSYVTKGNTCPDDGIQISGVGWLSDDDVEELKQRPFNKQRSSGSTFDEVMTQNHYGQYEYDTEIDEGNRRTRIHVITNGDGIQIYPNDGVDYSSNQCSADSTMIIGVTISQDMAQELKEKPFKRRGGMETPSDISSSGIMTSTSEWREYDTIIKSTRSRSTFHVRTNGRGIQIYRNDGNDYSGNTCGETATQIFGLNKDLSKATLKELKERPFKPRAVYTPSESSDGIMTPASSAASTDVEILTPSTDKTGGGGGHIRRINRD